MPVEIGERIRNLRKQRSLSLEQVSAKSGVALATLSRIENGKGSGTFRTHRKIADAFGLALTDFYRDLQPQEQEASVLAAHSEEAESFTYDEKASAIFLARQISGKQMLPQMIILQPGGQTALEEYLIGTERWVFGLAGEVSVHVGEKSYPLSPGETLYFKASLPHRFENNGQAESRLISVMSPAVL